MSYTQKLIENGNNSEDEKLRKNKVTKPNIKELTNKQRNWFSSFEKSRKELNGPGFNMDILESFIKKGYGFAVKADNGKYFTTNFEDNYPIHIGGI